MRLKIKVTPKATANRLDGWLYEDTLKARVCAPADKGRANEALIEMLAKELGCAKSRIRLVHGETSRMKVLEVPSNLGKKLKKE